MKKVKKSSTVVVRSVPAHGVGKIGTEATKIDRRPKSKTYKVLSNIGRSKDRNFEVLAAFAEIRDENGCFSLSEEAVEEVAARLRLKPWEIEYSIRKHADTFQEIQAQTFLEEQKLRSFAEPRPPGRVFIRNDHFGCIDMRLHLALKEKGV